MVNFFDNNSPGPALSGNQKKWLPPSSPCPEVIDRILQKYPPQPVETVGTELVTWVHNILIINNNNVTDKNVKYTIVNNPCNCNIGDVHKL